MHLISTLLSLICIFMLLGSIFIARNEWKLKRGWTRKRPSLLLMSFSCAKSERKWQNWQIGKLQKWSKTIFFKVVIQEKRYWFLSTFSSFNHSAVCERDSAIFCDHHSLSFQEYLKTPLYKLQNWFVLHFVLNWANCTTRTSLKFELRDKYLVFATCNRCDHHHSWSSMRSSGDQTRSSFDPVMTIVEMNVIIWRPLS